MNDGLGSATPAAIVFDWDNTLVDSWAVIHQALERTFTAFDKTPWTLDEVRQRVRASLRDSFPGLFGDRWEEAAKAFYDAYDSLHLEAIRPLQDVETMLASLREAGIYLGVVSNKNGTYLRREIAHLGWDRYFGAVVGAGDAPRDKPAPDPVHLVLNAAGIEAGPEVWFVGDSCVDMEIAHNTGCIPVLLGLGAAPDGEFDTYAPQMRFETCGALVGAAVGEQGNN